MIKSEKRPASEHALIAAEAALSLIPGGGVLATLLDHYIPSTWQTRREAVLRQLSDDMERLKGRLNDQRLRSEDFHITIAKVIREAIVEPHIEKQKAFRAILLNDAMSMEPNPEKELFIKITQDLIGNHIRMLRVLANPERYCQENLVALQAVQSITSMNKFQPGTSDISNLLTPAFPDISSDHWAVLLEGLYSYGLIKKGRDLLGLTAGVNSLLEKKTTPLGDRYIEYITLPF